MYFRMISLAFIKQKCEYSVNSRIINAPQLVVCSPLRFHSTLQTVHLTFDEHNK